MPPARTLPGAPFPGAFALGPEEVARRLHVSPERGLTPEEAARRRRRYGANLLRRRESRGVLSILLHQFRSVIVWLLAAAAGFSFMLGDLAEGAAIAVVLLLNGAIGFVTELRAARSMEALLSIAQVRTRVRRAGRLAEIDARELVPGDIVVLEAGDVVTADLRLLAASNLQADESALTGESVPVDKGTAPSGPEAAVADRAGMAFKGTAITRGAGEGVVVATGTATELGRISDLAQAADAEVSPLERRLDVLGQRLVWLTLALAVLTISAGVLRGFPAPEMVQTGIALAVAAVPEGLPVVATLSLARGMWRMAARNAVVTRLSSIETLGATTVILTDKTGTLTENRMTAVRYLLAGRDLTLGGEDAPVPSDARLAAALRIGLLCNNAELGDGPDGGRSGDPMELALLAAARRAGLERAAELARHPEVAEHAFHPDRKMMATVHREGGGYLYAVKGAPEAVTAACARELGPEGERPLDERGREEWTRRADMAAGDGLRLLALATKHAARAEEPPYEDLALVGFVCLLDPLRADVPAAIRDCLGAGVRVVMMTGDHAETAARIARDAGLGGDGFAVIGEREIAGIGPGEIGPDLRARLLAADVFARVTPETKLRLAALYQQAGHVVLMTGDGVNDAPALRKADIGIAMGRRGTQVAREAADMILKDDAFGTIVVAMRQGRAIFGNIRKFVVYLMSCNVSEVLVVGLAVGAGLPTPLLPLQILFLNLVTDVFPAFALGLGRGEEDIMRRPPRDPAEALVDRPRWALIGWLGFLVTLATLGAYGLALFRLGLETGQAVTVAFVTLALAQLWNVFNVRAAGGGLIVNEVTRNGYVWGALALCLGLIAAALWLPGLSGLLNLPSPGPAGYALALLASVLPFVAGQTALSLTRPAIASAGRGMTP